MTITKNLTHMLFITVFILITTTSSHLLHTMEPEAVKASDEIRLNADFQTYLFLSAINNDHQCYLPSELIQIIATNVSKLIDKECYEKHKEDTFEDPGMFICFIVEKCQKSISHTSITNIAKRCLRHCGKLVNQINRRNLTPLHILTILSGRCAEWIKVFKLIAEDEAWNIICMKDGKHNTILHNLAGQNATNELINELLSAAPNSQAAWNLIITPDINGETALDFAQRKNCTESVKLLESYRPKEQ